ncbi:MAG TPA: hypothetical protein VGK31_04705 [Thermoanaerobaculia bacterium]
MRRTLTSDRSVVTIEIGPVVLKVGAGHEVQNITIRWVWNHQRAIDQLDLVALLDDRVERRTAVETSIEITSSNAFDAVDPPLLTFRRDDPRREVVIVKCRHHAPTAAVIGRDEQIALMPRQQRRTAT